MLKVVVLALVACSVLAQNNETDTGYGVPEYTEAQPVDPSAAFASQQQAMMHHAKFLLTWGTAMGFSQYAQSQMQLFTLAQQAGSYDDDEDDDDDNIAMLQEDEIGPMYGFTGNNPYSATPYGNNAYGGLGGGYGAQQQEDDREPEDIELQGEFALAYALKIMHVQNFHDLAEAQNSHIQAQMALALLGGVAQNPAMAQIAYFLKYKDVLDTLRSSLKVQMHDVWSQWNLQEIIETQEFKKNSEQAASDEYVNSMTASKLYSMHVYQLVASIELQRLFIDMYVQQIIGYALGPVQGAQPAETPATPSEGGYGSLLEVEETAEPAEPANPSKPFIPAMLLAQPQIVLYYYQVMQFYEKFLNFALAQVWFKQAQLEMASGHLDSMEGVEQFPQMEKYVDMQVVYTLSSWSSVKMMIAYIEFLLMILPLIGAAAGSLGGSLGSLGNAAGSLAPLGSLAPALAMGSLGPVGGSLALGGSLGAGSLGGSLGGAGGAAGNYVAAPPASQAAMAFAHSLLQKEAGPSKDSAFVPESFNVAA